MEAKPQRAAGVVLLSSVVPDEHQKEVLSLLLSSSSVPLSSLDSSSYRNNPFLAFCQVNFII